MPVPRLYELLTQKRDEIVAAWIQDVRSAFGYENVSAVELRDHVPGFLDELSLVLRRLESGGPLPDETEHAAQHGLQRLRLGFNLYALVKEYGLLRKTILAFAKAEGVTVSLEDYEVVSEFLIDGIAQAVSQYGEEREAELHRQNGEHFAFVAHELRNPLMSAQLALGSLTSQSLLPPGRSTEVLKRSMVRIQDLVERSLNMALLGSQKELNRHGTDLRALIDEIVLEASPAAEEKHIRVQVEMTVVSEVDLDPRLVSSALANLVRNAIKFTSPNGHVNIRASQSLAAVHIDVSDSCGGLPPGKIDQLFTPFVQAGSDRSGFGLGLAIARRAIENHGGSISVKDRPGEGCTFTIHLPVRS
ncbi:MAG: sensor histidine kinase [Deltaproteobacteria bacterium]|nr:sensor histidine kinase [Deltaproteobacteria bacterium]